MGGYTAPIVRNPILIDPNNDAENLNKVLNKSSFGFTKKTTKTVDNNGNNNSSDYANL